MADIFSMSPSCSLSWESCLSWVALQDELGAIFLRQAQLLAHRAGQHEGCEPRLHRVEGTCRHAQRAQRLVQHLIFLLVEQVLQRAALGIGRIFGDDRLELRGHNRRVFGDLDFHHQLLRPVERLLHLLVEPVGLAIHQVEGAEQVNGRVRVAHHPHRGVGIGQAGRGGGGIAALREGRARKAGRDQQAQGKFLHHLHLASPVRGFVDRVRNSRA
jgi:hypothetical protein